MKKQYLMTTMALVGALLIATSASAEKPKWDHGKKHKKGLFEKVLHKAHFMLKNGKALELTDAQIEMIHDLKSEVKKTQIEMSSQVKLLKVDIHRELSRNPVNVEKVNSLIDQKYEVKKKLAKTMVAKLVELKSILNEEQMKKLKEIWMSGRD